MKKILVLLLAVLSFFQMQATHLMGGEITWECIKVGPDAGKYIFKLKLYRDCDGVSLPRVPLYQGSLPLYQGCLSIKGASLLRVPLY